MPKLGWDLIPGLGVLEREGMGEAGICEIEHSRLSRRGPGDR